MARTSRPTLKHALEYDQIIIRCCGGCGKEACRLYVIVADHLMQGTSFCRSCVIEQMEDEWE